MAAGHRDGTADLGALRSVHKERVAFVLAVLLASLGSAIVGGAHFWGLAPWVLGLISAVVLTGVVALGTIARGYVRIDLHEHGVTLRGRAGTRPVRFDDVLSVTSGTTRRGAAGEARSAKARRRHRQ